MRQEKSRFIDNNDGTITDNLTGLMWQQDTAPERYNWEDAMHYCENLEMAGYDDWRLPNVQELQGIVDYESYDPAINPVFTAESSWYWSSSTHESYTDGAWRVFFGHGYVVSSYHKAYVYYVRAVRG